MRRASRAGREALSHKGRGDQRPRCPRSIPVSQTSLIIRPPRPLRGAIMRRREAGQGAAPAGLVATRHSGGSGAPSGTTRSPCQELADGSVGAFDARRTGRKQGPLPETSAIGAPRGARVPQGTSHRILRLSARHPPSSRTRDASRQGERMSVRPLPQLPGAPPIPTFARNQQPGETLLGNAVRQYLPARQRDGPLCRLRSNARGDRRLGRDERCRAARRHGCPAQADGAARRSKRLDA